MVLKLKDRILAGPGGIERPLTPQELVDLVSAVDLANLELGEHLHYKDQCYARNTVIANEHFELVVICWRPGQASAVHDHGLSNCVYLVVAGTASEQLFALDERGEPRPAKSRTWNRGDITLADGKTIHQVVNSTDRDLVTVHIYSPPLGEAMTMFTPIPGA
jgi:cysteine dioxygenase